MRAVWRGRAVSDHEPIVDNATAAEIDIEMDRQQDWIARDANAMSLERMKDAAAR